MMDHLPPILEPIEDYPRLPYLGHICTFDGGQFATFPERKGWKLGGIDAFAGGLSRADGVEPSHLETSSFVQAWLYFGLLTEVFRIINIPLRTEDFIKASGQGSTVTTLQLCRYVLAWEKHEQSIPPPTQKSHLRKVLSLLHYAGDTVDGLLSFPRLQYAADELTMTRLVIAESIAVLGDSLMNAAKNIWEDEWEEIQTLELSRIRKRLRFCEPATLSLKRLELRGWCKSSRMMMHRLVDSTGLCYAGMLARPHMCTDHATCSMLECKSMQVDPKTYSSKHASDNCTCPTVLIDRARVAEIIKSGNIPCVRLHLESNSIELTDSSEEYIAFSHIWAHGMGNPFANGLPECQLRRLQGLATNIHQKRNLLQPSSGARQAPDRPPAFWIDTLCIPVGPEFKSARNDAILSLTRVFSDAYIVLVIDAELQAVSSRTASLEREIRMITCDWMRRVWTLQEALLTKPGNLFWQFKEAALSADQIWQQSSGKAPYHISYRVKRI